MADYKFIVVPLDHFSNETIVAELTAICAASGNEVTFRFKKATKRGYYVAHEFLTKLKCNKDSRIRFERYTQKGNGPIKPYNNPGRKTL